MVLGNIYGPTYTGTKGVVNLLSEKISGYNRINYAVKKRFVKTKFQHFSLKYQNYLHPGLFSVGRKLDTHAHMQCLQFL